MRKMEIYMLMVLPRRPANTLGRRAVPRRPGLLLRADPTAAYCLAGLSAPPACVRGCTQAECSAGLLLRTHALLSCWAAACVPRLDAAAC